MKILHLDNNHPLLEKQLSSAGFENHHDYSSAKSDIQKKIINYDGIIIRSRFPIDETFLYAAKNLKFIARVGAGVENIDVKYAQRNNIMLIAAPEGNRSAVAEHAIALLLNLMNHIKKADKEVRQGIWLREENRGFEIEGKTIGIIGYGNMGKAFAKRLKGFDCKVIFYDIKPGIEDENAQQVSLEELQKLSDIVSLHTPQTSETHHLINKKLIDGFTKPFWFINTARGKSVNTEDLSEALDNGKILGAGLDVLEYEKSSFENMFSEGELPTAFRYLMSSEKVLLSPHIAGWTVESKEKLATIIAEKIINKFSQIRY